MPKTRDTKDTRSSGRRLIFSRVYPDYDTRKASRSHLTDFSSKFSRILYLKAFNNNTFVFCILELTLSLASFSQKIISHNSKLRLFSVHPEGIISCAAERIVIVRQMGGSECFRLIHRVVIAKDKFM